MIHNSFDTLDLTKYKRFFVFGCSFTHYHWDTWADLLVRELPNVTEENYYNFGCSGAGNQYIQLTLNQAQNYYNFCETDFVAVMWSTFYREDRYFLKHGWVTPGNILSQSDYSEEIVNELFCPVGYFIRDCGIIDTTMRLLELSNFDAVGILGIPFLWQKIYSNLGTEHDKEENILHTWYPNIQNRLFPKDLKTQLYGNEAWPCSYYLTHLTGEKYHDYHPSIIDYGLFLERNKLKLSSSTKTHILTEHDRLKSSSKRSNFREMVPRRLAQ